MRIAKPFRFKQFEVAQDACAMKIGTDGVLLGAWAPNTNATTILDIGTGTGVIALMLAQRNTASTIHALEIDYDAAKQAQDNFHNSPWSERLNLHRGDLNTWNAPCQFVQIISNPPFYNDQHAAVGEARTNARHTSSLSYNTLLKAVARLLSDDGDFSCIIPAKEHELFCELALTHKLYLKKTQLVKGKQELPAKRSLLTFTKKKHHLQTVPSLIIEKDRHIYTEEYIALVKDFYLKM